MNLKKAKQKQSFGRKISNLQELKDLTSQALREGNKGNTYTISKEVALEDQAFKSFTSNFLLDQPWIDKEDTCIRVKRIKNRRNSFS